jgi:uncharacterized protein (TIGR03084 family)
MTEILTDLRAEHADLDGLVGAVDLARPTPAAGWTIGDTVSHLWFFTAGLAAIYADPDTWMARTIQEGRDLGDELPATWRTTRTELLAALDAADPASKVPWYGPPMAPASFATARLMEYWAHGHDIADALDRRRRPTARLRHICHLGVRTRNFSYVVRGLDPPAGDVYVELRGPDGDTWTWGDPAAPDRVDGTAEEFCLVVTQRRLVGDTGLAVTGPLATEWMSIAQAFAGGGTVTDPDRRGLSVAGPVEG